MQKMKELLKHFSEGKIAIVFDDKDRENEADMIVGIESLTVESVNFMIRYARGLLCAALSESIVKQKGFPLMPSLRNDMHATAFTLSVDSNKVKTGISPYERYVTAMDLIDESTTLADYITPGHIFPLAAKAGGILERNGHTEAAVSLCKWAGMREAALICEMIKDDGEMYTKEEAEEFAREHNLPFCTVEELINYQNSTFPNVELKAEAKLKTLYGEFDITVYEELYKNKEHVFLAKGDYREGPVRIHSECLTGDVFGSRTCDCQMQLHSALELIAKEGKGAVVYLRQEGRDIGLSEKIKAYKLQQEEGMDTVQANLELGHKVDQRDFNQAAWILKDKGFETLNLITNNPKKVEAMERHGFKVEPRVIPAHICEHNSRYLKTKKEKLGHKLEF